MRTPAGWLSARLVPPLLAVTLALAACALPGGLSPLTPARAETAADRFAPQRGFSTDIWVEWRSVADMVAEPGFLDTYPDYPRHMPPGTLARLHDQGFDTIRIAADPSPLMALWGTPRAEPLLANLRARVEEAQAAGLKVILDLHAFPHGGEIGDTDRTLARPDEFDRYLQVLGAVAARLDGMDPNRTALEVMNEPTEDCDVVDGLGVAARWPDHLARLHAAARAGAPALPLVLSGACWGGVAGLERVDPAAMHDDNLIWSFHSYDPFPFTHQGADWTDSILMFVRGLPYPPERLRPADAAVLVEQALARAQASAAPQAAEATRDALAELIGGYALTPRSATADPIVEAAAWADRNAIPRRRMLLGEFGALWRGPSGETTGALADHAAFLSDKVRAAEAAGLGWAVWSFTGSFAITGPDQALDPGVCRALGLPRC